MSIQDLTLDQIADLWDKGPVPGCPCEDCEDEHIAAWADELGVPAGGA